MTSTLVPPVVWPVLPNCPGTTHNTLNAARRPLVNRCICPRATELRDAFRAAENLARNGRRTQEYKSTQHLSGRQPSVLDKIDSASFLAPTGPDTLVPECRIDDHGGRLDKYQVEDFHEDGSGVFSELARQRAKAVCRRCPLQRQCLLQAVASQEPMGIWGGLTPKERRSPKAVAAELRSIQEA